jgi:hypothetical protein
MYFNKKYHYFNMHFNLHFQIFLKFIMANNFTILIAIKNFKYFLSLLKNKHNSYLNPYLYYVNNFLIYYKYTIKFKVFYWTQKYLQFNYY